MKVLQIHNHYRQAGGEDYVFEAEAGILNANGHEVRQFAVTNPADPAPTLLATVQAPWNRARAAEVRSLVRTWRPDIAVVYNTWFSLSPSVIRALVSENVPTAVMIDNYRTQCVSANFFRDGEVCTDCMNRVPWRGVARGCYRDSPVLSSVVAATSMLHRRIGTMRSANGLIVPSEWMKNTMLETGLGPDKIHVVPHSTADLGARSRPPSESAEVLCLGRIEPSKGFVQLAEDWISSGVSREGLGLRFVGDGSLADELDKLDAPGISRTPWVTPDSVSDLLLGARALICPSRWHEVFGLVVIEAFAAGLPVIVSDRGDLPELVSQGETGMVVAADDQAGWESALRQLADDELVDRLGAAARRKFEQRYRFESIAPTLVSAYEEIIASTG